MSQKFESRRGGGSGAYVCISCGKKTRETGYDESTYELCRRCNAEALLENSVSDGCIHTVTEALQTFLDCGGRQEEFVAPKGLPA